MHSQCPYCHLVFEREQGYWVGAIYINYAATALLAIAGFLTLDAFSDLSLFQQLVLWGIFAVAFPLFFFRYSRSIWLSIDYICTPVDFPTRRNLVTLRRRSHS